MLPRQFAEDGLVGTFKSGQVLQIALIGRINHEEINMAEETRDLEAVGLAVEVTIAWLSNPNTRVTSGEVTEFIAEVHKGIVDLGNSLERREETSQNDSNPKISARRSLSSPDHIISMIDGKPYKTLRRHLSKQGLTPEQYRQRFGLKADYPMVAPSYSDARREMAKAIGLGRKPRSGPEKAAPATPRGGRKSKVA